MKTFFTYYFFHYSRDRYSRAQHNVPTNVLWFVFFSCVKKNQGLCGEYLLTLFMCPKESRFMRRVFGYPFHVSKRIKVYAESFFLTLFMCPKESRVIGRGFIPKRSNCLGRKDSQNLCLFKICSNGCYKKSK